MYVSSIDLSGPAIDAEVPLPKPNTHLPEPLKMHDLLTELQEALDEYMELNACDIETGDISRHLDHNGVAFWMRTLSEKGAHYFRIIRRGDELRVEVAGSNEAPPALRPH